MANVKLSQAELDLVTDSSIILTKNAIITKVYDLFGQLSAVFDSLLEQSAFLSKNNIATSSPKISKGENYEGLPWVMLDHPRSFDKEHSFAIRTFFLWGNFFSITLQLEGKYHQQFINKISSTTMHDWFLCHHTDKWQHHFRANNYKPLAEFSKEEIHQLNFIKLAKKIPLHQWDEAEIVLLNAFSAIIKMLED